MYIFFRYRKCSVDIFDEVLVFFAWDKDIEIWMRFKYEMQKYEYTQQLLRPVYFPS